MSGLCVASTSQSNVAPLTPSERHAQPLGGRARPCGLALVWPGALLGSVPLLRAARGQLRPLQQQLPRVLQFRLCALLPVPEHLCSQRRSCSQAPSQCCPRVHPHACLPSERTAQQAEPARRPALGGAAGRGKVSGLTEPLPGAGPGCRCTLKGPGSSISTLLYLGGDRGAGWGSRHSWFGSPEPGATVLPSTARGGRGGGAPAWCQGAACVLRDSR